MRHFVFLIALIFVNVAQAAPGVLIFNPAADGGGTLANASACATIGCNLVVLDQDAPGAPLVADSGNSSATTITKLFTSSPPVNHAPYQVIAWPTTTDTHQYYAQLQAQIGVISLAKGPGNASNHQLPAIATNTTSVGSDDGSTGWGVTYGISKNYLGLDTSSDSNDAGITAGFLAALLYNHGTWNAFDANAALRIGSANWPTYDHTNYGFGLINWTTANAVATLYLQPPDMEIMNAGYYLTITLYPFRQSRRSAEVVYSVSSSYSWPRKNEYTAADIAASGGTLIYTSNGTDVTPQFSYAPAVSGTITLVAFTTDGSGNYSTEQEFSPISETVTLKSNCFQ